MVFGIQFEDMQRSSECVKTFASGTGRRILNPKRRSGRISFVSSLDNLIHLRRDLSALLEPADQQREILRSKKNLLQDLPHHAIVDRGRVIGLWEFETSSRKIAWSSFVSADKELKSAVAKTEEFVREQLGDARSFSLDSPESRASRIAALRA